jgi:hypothetical protein
VLESILRSSEKTGITFLAKIIIMIPSSSVCNERGFSGLRLNKTYLRTLIADEHMEWLLFLSLNLNSPIPESCLSLIAKKYLQDVERREGSRGETEKPNINTLFFYENFAKFHKECGGSEIIKTDFTGKSFEFVESKSEIKKTVEQYLDEHSLMLFAVPGDGV